jgi:hypothetical protein
VHVVRTETLKKMRGSLAAAYERGARKFRNALRDLAK